MISSVCAIVIMGVSGCGKTTLGKRLAEATGFRFIEGDDLHTDENVAKMSAGVPLEDSDRWPWLVRVATELDHDSDSSGQIVSCSSLKRIYRDFIRARARMPLLFVFPEASSEVLLERMTHRPGHYMPLSLLSSQLATLERPQSDEPVLTLDGTLTPDALVKQVICALTSGKAYPNTHTLPLEGAQKTIRI